MFVDRYDKNGTQIRVDDYLLHIEGGIYKVIYNAELLCVGIVDDNSNFFFMSDWKKEDWEVKTYEELFKE